MLRMRKYLALLPEAELSYPQCQIRAGLVNLTLEHQAFRVPQDAPDWLRKFVEERKPATQLVSLVQCNAMVLAMVDEVFGGDVERYLKFNYEVNRKFGQHPAYSLLYKLISPSFVMRTLPMAFGQLMPGIKAVLKADEGGGTVMLSFPKHMYDATLARGWAAAFKAMIECAGGTNADAQLVDSSAAHAHIRVNWA